MIPKKLLKEIVDLLQTQDKKEIKFADFMEDFLDGRCVPTLSTDVISAFHKLAAYTFNDVDTDMTWLEWFIYECDYGESPKSAFIGKQEYIIDSFDAFYDFLLVWDDHIFNDFEQYMHHGKNMWVNSNLKGKHKKHCLCWSCSKFFPGDSDKNCSIAQRLFEININDNIVTPVWECENFKRKTF